MGICSSKNAVRVEDDKKVSLKTEPPVTQIHEEIKKTEPQVTQTQEESKKTEPNVTNTDEESKKIEPVTQTHEESRIMEPNVTHSEEESSGISVIFLRHGESTWNSENRFTGWTDVPLSAKGESEAKDAGLLLKDMMFDQIYTSALDRSIKTCQLLALPSDIPVSKEWRLNERHYGALQGLNKSETTEKHGEEQVKIWRRSYDIPPPLLDISDERHPRNDKKYTEEMEVDPIDLPAGGESLKDCVGRVLPLWTNTIGPKITEGKNILIVAHGNSLRALVKHLSNISDEAIAELNIPTGIPLVFVLDKKTLLPIKPFCYLGDAAAAKAKADLVAAQALQK